jgi:RimJ/RimL family protein N-acetyltransferase
MINIREVSIDDAEKISALLQRLVYEAPPVALELEPLIMKGKKWIAQFPSGELGHFIVAEVGEEIIGFCYLAVPKFYKPIAYIGIAMSKEYRRKDIGSRMFYHVAEWAAEEHLQYIFSDVWSWNIEGLKFFEKLGFEEKTRFTDKFKGKDEEKVRLIKKL